jgi:acetyl/propionyl-CoA carboxylase alpha subunit
MADNKIQVKGDFYYEEGTAAAAISPGHLVYKNSAGKWAVNAAAGLACLKAFAVEQRLAGKTIDDAYAADDQVFIQIPYPGAIVQARIKDGENIAVGDKLVSAGDGTLKEMTADASATIVEETCLAIAEEACDMSDSSAADPDGFCKVRII